MLDRACGDVMRFRSDVYYVSRPKIGGAGQSSNMVLTVETVHSLAVVETMDSRMDSGAFSECCCTTAADMIAVTCRRTHITQAAS